jgi:hypothetical protein
MTDSTNIDNALAYLGTSLKSLIDSSQQPIDLKNIASHISKRSLSGDHIYGGKIVNFSSLGITDEAKDTQIKISDDLVCIKFLSVEKINGDLAIEKTVSAENLIVSGTVKAGKLEVSELTSDLRLERSASLEFKVPKGENLYTKGLLWVGDGYTKQFIFSNPDRFFSSESIDLSKNKYYAINGIPTLTETELGLSVIHSNLKKVGTLQGLLVSGNVSIDQYIFYNAANNRLGIGTEAPNAALSVAENAIEVMLGTNDAFHGMVGTFASTDFDIVTDNTTRIAVKANGNIELGNPNRNPIQVNINGKLSVGVKNPDPAVDLHVAGAVRFSGHIHMYAATPPDYGSFNRGDIVWNSSPELGKSAGWICVREGAPGTWLPFGEIKPQMK